MAEPKRSLPQRAVVGVRQVLAWGVWLRHKAAAAATTAAAWCLLVAVALSERVRVLWRRARRKSPRLVWGPSAIFNIVYWSRALRDRGWESVTCVDVLPMQAKREDFDVRGDELAERSRLPRALRPYAQFVWALRHGDVFLMNFDGGHLRWTPFYWREYPLIKLAGKKLVVLPYGGDIAVVGHLGKWHEAWLRDYPQLPEHAEGLERKIAYAARWADATIRTKQVGLNPPSDVWWDAGLAIDVEHWTAAGRDSGHDGRDGAVSVIHAPNHRALKRTDALEAAVETLRREGFKIDLRILEGRSNEEVRRAMLDTDIVGDQFSGGGYALFAIEGMAAGKPVLSGVSGDPEFVAPLRERGCPIVDTDEERLTEDLRSLVTDPTLRQRLGRLGREFVIANHSHDSVARDWEAIIDFAWRGAPLPDRLRPRDR